MVFLKTFRKHQDFAKSKAPKIRMIRIIKIKQSQFISIKPIKLDVEKQILKVLNCRKDEFINNSSNSNTLGQNLVGLTFFLEL